MLRSLEPFRLGLVDWLIVLWPAIFDGLVDICICGPGWVERSDLLFRYAIASVYRMQLLARVTLQLAV